MTRSNISVVIPTYGRENVLCQTLRDVLASRPEPTEVVVVDQTPNHDRATVEFLESCSAAGKLRWIRLEQPSIPKAMNTGLTAARSEIVLFLDDDVEASSGLLAAHANAHREFTNVWAVAGQVLQPGESSGTPLEFRRREGPLADLAFPFWSNERAWIANVMAGNLSVKRDRALACGGFDENFAGVAYRFETEFARRMVRRGGRILFEPAASIRHLRAARGGTRLQGSHLTSASPRHGQGDYYFAMQCGWNMQSIAYMLRRPVREVTTRFHLRHPWFIPVKLLGEVRSFYAALMSWRRGPRLLAAPSQTGSPTVELPDDRSSADVSIATKSPACRPS